MAAEMQTLKYQQEIKASPAQVFYAFTNATALREWLCDGATVDPRPGGRFYVWWNEGYYNAGLYTSVEADHSIDFTWHGHPEPKPTQVEVDLSPRGQGTLLELMHTGMGSGAEWTQIIAEFDRAWKRALENLTSVLETGRDLRLLRRPMLGIGLSDFNAAIAAQLEVPVSVGVRLDNVLDGMGAQAAGLQKDDVLVSLDGQPLDSYASLVQVVQKHDAGDTLAVEYYRGPEKRQTPMTLSARPVPIVPAQPVELARAVKANYESAYDALAASFDGVSEAEAGAKPAPSEWSAKETLAHLIQEERALQNFIIQLVGGQEQVADGFAGNLDAALEATLVAYPTLPDLLLEFKRSTIETIALVERLPEAFLQRKGSYWRLAQGLLQLSLHFQGHTDQITAAIAAARKPA